MASTEMVAARALRRSSTGTLHYQLFSELRNAIADGRLKPGDRLSTESELSTMYSVSRTTVRRALDDLRREGFIKREPGRGSFVLPPRLSASIPYLHAVADELEALGYRAGIHSVTVRESRADAAVAETLVLEPGDPILSVERVRTADDRPVYIGVSRLDVTRYPALRDADYLEGAIYRIVERVCGRRVVKARQWLSAVRAPERVAKALELDMSDPVLKLERIIVLEGELPVASIEGYFHGELYKHYSEVHAPSR